MEWREFAPEIRLHGRAVPIQRDELLGTDVNAWWFSHAEGTFALVSLDSESRVVRRTRSYP